MEGTKKPTSSSFTSDLFGSKETSASSSSGIFGSIFPPPNKGHGSVNSEQSKQDPVIQARNAKGGSSGSTPTNTEAASQAGQNKQPTRHTQPSTKIMEKMILAAHLEETGGKGLFTTKSSPPMTWMLHILKEVKYIEKSSYLPQY
ncbi:hypothetical protein K7X08_000423 [Anisodus acutangulus]|uniref:Uncharacterized protein n=1 Tax=Anisodus acutangulus TaxID=402998 RepID=A0A9Q1M6Y4_9SOLA|nr:hypothetical protein K7X08_000423 [Anisodus acutangulus]